MVGDNTNQRLNRYLGVLTRFPLYPRKKNRGMPLQSLTLLCNQNVLLTLYFSDLYDAQPMQGFHDWIGRIELPPLTRKIW